MIRMRNFILCFGGYKHIYKEYGNKGSSWWLNINLPGIIAANEIDSFRETSG